MYDLTIIGGGPAGVAAGVYAARKQLRTVLITPEVGGQSTVSADIQNWIGTPSISGAELARTLETHLMGYKGSYLELFIGESAKKIETSADGFLIATDTGKTTQSRAILIASGASRRKLDVPGAATFDQKGLTYCASCDGPLFSGMDVAVIGGGNAGFETAAQLLAYVKSVSLLDIHSSFKADPITVEKVLKHPNMRAFTNAETTCIEGDTFVTGLRYRDKAQGTESSIAVKGVFVEIGVLPNTAFAADVVALDEYKRVIVDPRTQQTNTPNIWAAGDCTNELYHQNNIAAGDAVKALENIYVHLRAR